MPLVKSTNANQSAIYFHLKLETSITPLGVIKGLVSLFGSLKSLNIGLVYSFTISTPNSSLAYGATIHTFFSLWPPKSIPS